MSLRLVILGLLMVLLGSTGHASPTIGKPVTWDVGGGPLGWVNLDGSAQSVNSVDSGDPSRGGFLQILFNVGDPPTPQFGKVENSVNFLGDYSGLVVSFDYLGYTTSPRNLYFMSENERLWTYDIPNTTTSWETLSVSFVTQGAWNSDGGGVFGSDLKHVTSLGFYLQTPDGASGPVIFGIDNLEFTNEVPEPSTVMMLLSVILCLLVTFRVDRFIVLPDWIKRLKHR